MLSKKGKKQKQILFYYLYIMFRVIRDYKSLFLLTLKSEFNQGDIIKIEDTQVQDKNKNGILIDDLIKQVQENWVNSEELKKIQDTYEYEKVKLEKNLEIKNKIDVFEKDVTIDLLKKGLIIPRNWCKDFVDRVSRISGAKLNKNQISFPRKLDKNFWPNIYKIELDKWELVIRMFGPRDNIISGESNKEFDYIESQVVEEKLALEKLQETGLNLAKSFYERVKVTPENIKQIQKKLNVVVDWKFGQETFDALVKFQGDNNLDKDWKAWTQTLKKLELIEESKTLKDFYGKKLQEIKEKDSTVKDSTVKDSTVKDSTKKDSAIKDNIIDDIWDNLNASVDYVSEKYTKVKEWIKELLKGDNIDYFIWANGKKVNIEFDDKTDKFSMDTPWFDSVRDNEFDLSNFYKDIKTPDEAKSQIKEIREQMKKMYDDKVMDNAISYVQKEEETFSNLDEKSNEIKDKSVVISTFKVENIEKPLKVRLSRKYDIDGKLKWIFVWIDTTFSDWVRDNKVSVKITSDINKDSIDRVVEESKALYKIEKTKAKAKKKEGNWFRKIFSKEK